MGVRDDCGRDSRGDGGKGNRRQLAPVPGSDEWMRPPLGPGAAVCGPGLAVPVTQRLSVRQSAFDRVQGNSNSNRAAENHAPARAHLPLVVVGAPRRQDGRSEGTFEPPNVGHIDGRAMETSLVAPPPMVGVETGAAAEDALVLDSAVLEDQDKQLCIQDGMAS